MLLYDYDNLPNNLPFFIHLPRSPPQRCIPRFPGAAASAARDQAVPRLVRGLARAFQADFHGDFMVFLMDVHRNLWDFHRNLEMDIYILYISYIYILYISYIYIYIIYISYIYIIYIIYIYISLSLSFSLPPSLPLSLSLSLPMYIFWIYMIV